MKIDEGEPVWSYGKRRPEPIPNLDDPLAELAILPIPQHALPPAKTLEALRRALDGRGLMDAASGQSIELITDEVADVDDLCVSIEIGD